VFAGGLRPATQPRVSHLSPAGCGFADHRRTRSTSRAAGTTAHRPRRRGIPRRGDTPSSTTTIPRTPPRCSSYSPNSPAQPSTFGGRRPPTDHRLLRSAPEAGPPV